MIESRFTGRAGARSGAGVCGTGSRRHRGLSGVATEPWRDGPVTGRDQPSFDGDAGSRGAARR